MIPRRGYPLVAPNNTVTVVSVNSVVMNLIQYLVNVKHDFLVDLKCFSYIWDLAHLKYILKYELAIKTLKFRFGLIILKHI